MRRARDLSPKDQAAWVSQASSCRPALRKPLRGVQVVSLFNHGGTKCCKRQHIMVNRKADGLTVREHNDILLENARAARFSPPFLRNQRVVKCTRSPANAIRDHCSSERGASHLYGSARKAGVKQGASKRLAGFTRSVTQKATTRRRT
jgi:hypothetical protein